MSPAGSNAARVDFLMRLLHVWDANPRLRFGQLLGSVYRAGDQFYVTNEQFIADMERFYTEHACAERSTNLDDRPANLHRPIPRDHPEGPA